ncbi:MAG: tandem-95 repeat protein [Ardenticatenaceae bacterium]|nr:tandem-95 repeat protein [Ardenticatenaceae bacterium]
MTASFSFRKTILFSILAVGFALLWQPQPTLAAPLLIDDFDVSPTQFLTVACCGGSASSALDNTGTLGGERDIETTMLTGLFGSQDVFAGPPLNSLFHSQDPLMTGWTRVVWDGDDNDAVTLDATGLGGLDFTDGGSNSGLFVQIASANGTADLTFTAYTDGTNFSEATLPVSAGTNNQSFFIPFTSFTVQGGTGADFANIGAFALYIDGSSTPGFQLLLDTLALSNYDFGDLPAAYALTTTANNGARHLIGDLYLGTAVDSEADGQVSANADGDDANGLDDEDGISPVGAWAVGVNGGAVNVIASGPGCVSGWIDWGHNNNFSDAGDAILVMAEVATGTNTLSFDIPAGTILGGNSFYGRFRLIPDTGTTPDCSDDTAIGLTGEVTNGEVEDHLLSPAGLSISDVTVDEAAGTATFTVSLSTLVAVDVAVDYTTNNGTAVAPGDYTATNGTITIPMNTISTTLSVTIIDDTLVEGSETFTVDLSNATNAAIADSQGLGTITDNDSAPVANNDFYTVAEDAVLNIAATGVLSNDTDIDLDPLTAVLNTPPANGTVNLNLDGSFTYTPTANFNGNDNFTYHANDGTNNSNIATVSIEVTPVNDPLTAVNDTITTTEDMPINIDVLLNDIDVDGDANVVTVTVPANGTAVINSNSVDYTPAAEFSGTDVFDYTISDGVFTDTATVTITVTVVNDPPTAVDDGDTTSEDSPVTTDVLANDFDIDGNIDPATLSIDSSPSNGSATADPATGVITYTPSLNFNGVDSYDYEICDDGTPLPAACATATVVITVTAVNDPPTAVDDTAITLEDTEVVIDVLDNDINVDPTDVLTVTAVTPPTNGTTTLNPNNTITYSPTLNFTGTALFSYTISDGVFTDTAVVTVTVFDINDVPVVTLNVVTTPTLEGTPIQFNGIILDPSRPAEGGSGLLWDFGDGTTLTTTLTPTHTYPENGTFTVTLTYTDSMGLSGSDLVVIQVANVAPIVSAGSDQTIPFGATAAFNGSFTDPGTLDSHFIEWDFGDGESVFNTLTANHTYAAPGTYTVTLSVMDDETATGTDQLIVNVVQSVIYLPLVTNNAVHAPDLEVQLITVTPDNVTIIIENSGNTAVANGFWVDLYINPDPAPTAANQTWDQLSEAGIVWGITDIEALIPGGILVIDLNHPALDPDLTDFSGTFTDGMEIYVQVDSADVTRESGGVRETHEITNEPYNNIGHITVSLNP